MVRVVVIALALVASLACEASACGRCGRRGNYCRYYVKPVAYAPANYTTNFLFNNIFPYSQQGQSVYGVQTASYRDDSILLQDRNVRALEQIGVNQQLIIESERERSSQQLAYMEAQSRREANAQVFSLAAQALSSNNGPQQQQFSVQIVNGQPRIVQPPPPQQLQQQGPQQLVQAMSCAACHDGRGTKGAPKHIILDGSVDIDQPTIELSSTAVISGKMPPGGNLTAAQKTVVISSLHSLLARPRLGNEQPPPAPMPPADNNFGKPPGGLELQLPPKENQE
jgi:cytochrome c553